MRARRNSRERGFVLIAMSVAMVLMLAVMGMAFDFGRIYIARNEAQVFTDAAAMAAASKLDGTDAGLDRARQAVARLPMRWNLGTKSSPAWWSSSARTNIGPASRLPTIKWRSRSCAPWVGRPYSPFRRTVSPRRIP